MASYDPLQELERRSREQRDAVLSFLRDSGRDDLAQELIDKYREIDLGISGARSTWEALTPRQRRVMFILQRHSGKLHRRQHRQIFDLVDNGVVNFISVAATPTIRNLIARGLLDLEGGAFDPEAVVVMSDYGRFVMKKGRPAGGLDPEEAIG